VYIQPKYLADIESGKYILILKCNKLSIDWTQGGWSWERLIFVTQSYPYYIPIPSTENTGTFNKFSIIYNFNSKNYITIIYGENKFVISSYYNNYGNLYPYVRMSVRNGRVNIYEPYIILLWNRTLLNEFGEPKPTTI